MLRGSDWGRTEVGTGVGGSGGWEFGGLELEFEGVLGVGGLGSEFGLHLGLPKP